MANSASYLAVLSLSMIAVDMFIDAETEFKMVPFECPFPGCDRIVGVTQDPLTRQTYVTTLKTLKKLDGHFRAVVDVNTQVNTSDASDNVLAILIDEGSNMVLCRNDVTGTCELRSSDRLSLVSGTRLHGKVSRGPGADNPIGWVDDGPGRMEVLNVAVSSSEGTPTGEAGVPLIATRSLQRGYQARYRFLEFLEDDFSIPSSLYEPTSCATVDIKPIYGFSTEKYRYLLKQHTSRTNGRTELKLVRICKNATTYRSYIELPIECDYTGSYQQRARGSGAIISAAAYFADSSLYVSVTRPHPRAVGDIISDVCTYHVAWIDDRFHQRRGQCLQAGTTTTEMDWDLSTRCPARPLPHSQFNRLYEEDYCYDLPVAQPLGGREPIRSAPTEYLTITHKIITAIVVASPSGSETPSYMLGDKEGYVHRVRNRVMETVPVDVGRSILPQQGLILHYDRDHVVASTKRKVMLVPLEYIPTTTRPPPTHPRTRGGDSNMNGDTPGKFGKDDSDGGGDSNMNGDTSGKSGKDDSDGGGDSNMNGDTSGKSEKDDRGGGGVSARCHWILIGLCLLVVRYQHRSLL